MREICPEATPLYIQVLTVVPSVLCGLDTETEQPPTADGSTAERLTPHVEIDLEDSAKAHLHRGTTSSAEYLAALLLRHGGPYGRSLAVTE